MYKSLQFSWLSIRQYQPSKGECSHVDERFAIVERVAASEQVGEFAGVCNDDYISEVRQ